MTTPIPARDFPRWDANHAATLDAARLLLYRSNLLGSDLRITNYGGGNTSAKIWQADPLTGQQVQVLWVKGSGGDLGSMALDGFSTLYMDKLLALQAIYRGPGHEDEMVGYLPHCTFNLNPRVASIDTPLHAYLPFAHVDHMHPDAVIAIAAMADSEKLTQQIFAGTVGWLPWRRPGFELGLMLQRYQAAHPGQRGLVLAGHGLFSWGDDARACYDNTVGLIASAQNWLDRERVVRQVPSFGGPARQALSQDEQDATLARVLPVLRGLASKTGPKLLHVERQAAVLEFVNSRDLAPLAALGTSCPDHFLRTKIRPLILEPAVYMLQGAALAQALQERLAAYRADYGAYYQRCRRADSPALRDANPVIVLLPGIGMVAMAKDKATARIAAEFYVNAINVMREAHAIDRYVGLPEQEAFDIEYWWLEEAKLQRSPPPKPLAGKVALVTGGAGGIGRAIARRVLAEGACVVLVDIDQGALATVTAELAQAHGPDHVRGLQCDVTSEASVIAAFRHAALEFGGLDIAVSNAGIAAAAPLEDTSIELWNHSQGVLATGYFLVGREAFRLMKAQGAGGSIVVIASKNGMVASPQASAYCAAKAAEIQLSRSFALEGAPWGIRSNVVNPDAVIRGSRIWSGKWSAERAAANKIAEQDLEAFYRDRSMLKRSVLPEDIAEAAYFFAAERLSAKSTGNILNVDAGNLAAFTR
ncbi:bifunctional rhamnulose-1-phosphate aldolase/short-chain dehydrogenase [Verminephrobacter eiseniae]|uniref:Rhamnulose-1-phosphate aldolase/alcohol dehydrogenase n=1 Tax=Verminephrobacter eiseniae (strain EF01-2) TaxID=391735 RepID=A1WJQ7_VEREI|nr:bifunctional rhamnulose-1-phosphate aldolase/short-chain dehydrogenase [Verminephrobacter eiseniae]ABM57864.1 rhamnulose-1-phosphate aldolase/alcohol dehydrogenase [Verminephrobacter eiseniae EF01-2]MCW5283471.1 bifunctional rhamnulose-1-phosphate aldolase/short-chain dehydrogenase [Verminephrobacter eiseniae]MCW5301180.1 bifunctional rhamnulose-1-phosphate aldolase/short-chain dehydrogenase [Verminephrobacter eiseniae]MCW8180176.1 bifunctional rhamnulose-1-phosphate aldolase/short-chain deh